MVSVRIKADHRDHIIMEAVEHSTGKAFKKAEEALKKAMKAVNTHGAKAGYNVCFTPKKRKILNEAPDGWFPLQNHCYVSRDGRGLTRIKFNEKKRVPYSNYCGSNPSAVVIEDHPFFEKLDALQMVVTERKEELDVIKQQRAQLRAEVGAVIGTVTTIKRLLEVWPECKNFLPDVNSAPSGLPPAVLISELNKKLGV